MEDRIQQLESRIDDLAKGFARLERRVATLEGSPVPLPEAVAEGPSETEAEPAPLSLDEMSLSNAATNLGRILLIFGGAYLLRTITDFEFLPTGAGVLLGVAYALLWLFMAYRAGGSSEPRTTAILYGTASVLMALPILVEATTRFALLSGRQSAWALTVFYLLVMAVAVSRNLRSIAWLATLGSIVTALALLRISQTVTPFAVFLVLLGLVTLWAIYVRQWKGLHWFGALGADLALVIAALLGTNERWSVSLSAIYFLAIGLVIVFLMSFVVRSHLQRRTVGLFEATQALLILAVALWAILRIVDAGQFDLTLLGYVCLALGVGAYGLAFSPQTRTTRGRNFFFYSSLGLLLIVGGSAVLTSPGKAAAAWSMLAVIMAWFSGRYGRVTLSLQCTLLLIAAGIGSGVLKTGLQALAGSGIESWPTPIPWHLIVAGATVLCLFLPVAQHSERWGRLAGLPQLVVLALSVWEVGGLLVAYSAPLLAGVPGPAADLGLLAALRTAVLSAASVTLALSSRHKRWPEARWLAYPVLLLVGIKMLTDDFPNGRPLTLFIALALVGGSLIAVARLLHRDRQAQQEA